MAITGFDAYRSYIATKLHFKSGGTYNARKYNYGTSVKESSFFARRDKYHFDKIARKTGSLEKCRWYFLANFMHDEKAWIGKIAGDEGHEIFSSWLQRQESLSYIFENDLRRIQDLHDDKSFDWFLTVSDGVPPLIDLWVDGQINLETVVILQILTNFLDHANKKLSDDVIFWGPIYEKLYKYIQLFDQSNIDHHRFKKLILKVFDG